MGVSNVMLERVAGTSRHRTCMGAAFLLLFSQGCSGLGCASSAGCADGVDPLRTDIQRGICLAHNYQHNGRNGYGTPTSASTLRELSDLGVGWVSLSPFGFAPNLASTVVQHIGTMRAGETDDRVVGEIRAARRQGMKILLKPQIWISGGQWRGELSPKEGQGWAEWFTSYRSWILRYAELAQAHQVEVLAIGVELKSSAIALGEQWRELVTAIREVYKGKIVYCANWDAVAKIDWWDAVDYMGVQFYGSLADSKWPSDAEMRARLKGHLDHVEKVALSVDRPVLFTEVGYRSADGAASKPYQWPERDTHATVDVHEQERAYRVFMEGINERPWARGIYWWKWFTDPETDEEGPDGFSPKGKPAEAVLRAAYAGKCDS